MRAMARVVDSQDVEVAMEIVTTLRGWKAVRKATDIAIPKNITSPFSEHRRLNLCGDGE